MIGISRAGISEKRTDINLSILSERVKAMGGVWPSVNNAQQLADRLANISSRQDLADILWKEFHALNFDRELKAGKKVTQAERQQHQRDLDEHANAKWKSRTPKAAQAMTATAVLTQVVRSRSTDRVSSLASSGSSWASCLQ